MGDTLFRFRNKIIVGDVRDGLSKLPDESIDCVITSPPYWGLRDYGIEPTVWDGTKGCSHRWASMGRNSVYETRSAEEKRAGGSAVGTSEHSSEYAPREFGQTCKRCGAWRGCLGLEPSIDLFMQHLLQVFDEIRRVLKPTGTCWVNLGDSYAGGWGARNRKLSATRVPAKSLNLIPHRFAIAMLERGWLLRNHVIWHKPNHLPSSVKDRLATTWDHVLFFVKSRRYFFDLDAIRIPHRSVEKYARGRIRKRDPLRDLGSAAENAFHSRGKNPGDYWTVPAETRRHGAILGVSGAVKVPGGAGWTGHPPGGQARILREADPRWLSPNGKNPGDAWEILSRAGAFAHFATFPEALVERPIKAGCPPLVCKQCGVPKRDIRKRPPNPNAFAMKLRDAQAGKRVPGRKLSEEVVQAYDDAAYTSKGGTLVVSPGCGCRKGFAPGLVLDPFMGSGTTAVVARRLGRDYLGFEINAEYARLARRRVRNAA